MTSRDTSAETGFERTATVVLESLAREVPFSVWLVSRHSDEDCVVLASCDRRYGLSPGDVVPRASTLCARLGDDGAAVAVPDVRLHPVLGPAARALELDVGAYLTVPLTSTEGQVVGTLCGADPGSRTDLDGELRQAGRTAGVLAMLLDQQLQLERVGRSEQLWCDETNRDPLTGLGNRRFWEDAANRVEHQCRGLGSSASVAVVELVGLREVNDTAGHLAGDTIIRAAAAVLRNQLRRDYVVARTGGDEFSLLLVDLESGAAQATVDRLGVALDAAGVTASLGAARRRRDGSVVEAWREADAVRSEEKRRRQEVALGSTAAPPADRSALGGDGFVAELLREARQTMGMSVAFVSRFEGDRRVIEAVDAEGSVPMAEGDVEPLMATLCHHMVSGVIPESLPDVSADPVAQRVMAGHPVEVQDAVRCYVGVPITLADGSVYGALCTVSGEQREVDERDTAMLRFVARTIGVQVTARAEADRMSTDIRHRLEGVMEQGGLTSVYQPVIDLASGAVRALEALARFPSAYGRTPDQWFADAAAVGRQVELETHAARTGSAALTTLPPAVRVSVNVSPRVVEAAEFRAWLDACPLDRLVLELTEHAPIEDYASLVRVLEPLRAGGLLVAVDDAGAGYASMRHCLQLRPDLLKLDLSLVRDVDTDPDKRALCRAMTDFAHSADALVVAEGIETELELETVRALGVDLVQGFHLQRPLSLVEMRGTGRPIGDRLAPLVP